MLTLCNQPQFVPKGTEYSQLLAPHDIAAEFFARTQKIPVNHPKENILKAEIDHLGEFLFARRSINSHDAKLVLKEIESTSGAKLKSI